MQIIASFAKNMTTFVFIMLLIISAIGGVLVGVAINNGCADNNGGTNGEHTGTLWTSLICGIIIAFVSLAMVFTIARTTPKIHGKSPHGVYTGLYQ